MDVGCWMLDGRWWMVDCRPDEKGEESVDYRDRGGWKNSRHERERECMHMSVQVSRGRSRRTVHTEQETMDGWMGLTAVERNETQSSTVSE